MENSTFHLAKSYKKIYLPVWSVYNFTFEVKDNNGGNNNNLLSECEKLKNTVQEKKPEKKNDHEITNNQLTKRVSMITENWDGDESNGKSLFSNRNYGYEKLITFILSSF